MKTVLKCECPEEGTGTSDASLYSAEELPGRIHKPGECPCTNDLKRYKRDSKILILCSACFFPTDIPIE